MDLDPTRLTSLYVPTNPWHPNNLPLPPPWLLPPSQPLNIPPLIQYPWNPFYSSLIPPSNLQLSSPSPTPHHTPTPQQRHRRRHTRKKHATKLTSDTHVLNRSWVSLSQSSQKDKNEVQEFSLLSYNILAQNLMDLHGDLYTQCDSVYSKWEYRKYYLLEQLIDSSADILCLQEVERSAYDSFFSPNLKEKNYSGAYKCRTGHNNDGVAIFFKTDKFELVSCKLIEFYRRCPVLDRDNVAIILKLKLLNSTSSTTDDFLYVATTHLIFSPKAGDVKLAQLCTLFAELGELTIQDKDIHPVVICGDFNFLPNSCLYNFLRTGYLNYKYLCRTEVAGYKRRSSALIPHPLIPPDVGINNACKKIHTSDTKCENNDNNSDITTTIQKGDKAFVLSHPYTFHSVYPHPITGPSLVSTFHQLAFENVDYIFYSSPELEIDDEGGYKASRQLKLVSRYSMPTRMDLKKFGPLPNKFHSSDHLQLISKFCYLR